jgi:Domain of unknown function (DUF4326)
MNRRQGRREKGELDDTNWRQEPQGTRETSGGRIKEVGLEPAGIADELEISVGTVNGLFKNVGANIFEQLTEPLLMEAAEVWADDENGEIAEILEDLMEEMIFGHWSEAERELLSAFRSGEGIVVNMHENGPHANLVKWLADTNQLTKADRKTKWGNPFIMPGDGDRDEVVDKYDRYYLPHKPKLLDRLPTMAGTAWGCWCAPQLCHCHVLKAKAEELSPGVQRPLGRM